MLTGQKLQQSLSAALHKCSRITTKTPPPDPLTDYCFINVLLKKLVSFYNCVGEEKPERERRAKGAWVIGFTLPSVTLSNMETHPVNKAVVERDVTEEQRE